MSGTRSISILGVTGSIGDSVADLILSAPDCFNIRLVSAHSNVAKLAERAQALQADCAVITRSDLLTDLQQALQGTDIQASCDIESSIADHPVDMTLAAIMGMAGLRPLVASMSVSQAVAIANKEPLVAAGPQVLAAAQETGCDILPVDSEHNAVHQVFAYDNKQAIERIVLTASGGAFRDWPVDNIANASKADALKHPNWVMGQKITIDSATMMNKVLEVIEASVLFDLPADKIDVMIHPQSVVHGMVEYCDGSVLAQMGASDMRTPIANILFGGAERFPTSGRRLDLKTMNRLDFQELDAQRYPAMDLAYRALAKGQYACVAINAWNEIAVEAFLSDEITFGDITNINKYGLECAPDQGFVTLDDVILYDKARRDDAREYISLSSKKRA